MSYTIYLLDAVKSRFTSSTLVECDIIGSIEKLNIGDAEKCL